MLRIGALYGIEEEIRGKPAEHRCSVRQARARPLLDSLSHWMEKALRSLSTKSERQPPSAMRFPTGVL